MSDTVNQALSDMSMSPELLNQYSEHAKQILPEFTQQGGNQAPQYQQPQYQQYNDNSHQQALTPEQQMQLMQNIQNANITQDYQQPQQGGYSEPEVETVSVEAEHYTEESSEKSLLYKILSTLKILLVLFVVLFIFYIPGITTFINRNILHGISGQHVLILSLIKSGIATVAFYLATFVFRIDISK